MANETDCSADQNEDTVKNELLNEIASIDQDVKTTDDIDFENLCIEGDEGCSELATDAMRDVEEFESVNGALYEPDIKCAIRENQYKSCAAIMEQTKIDNMKKGQYYSSSKGRHISSIIKEKSLCYPASYNSTENFIATGTKVHPKVYRRVQRKGRHLVLVRC